MRYLSEDEAYRNIYGDTVVIFLPNLLTADNYLKLITVYKKMERIKISLRQSGMGKSIFPALLRV